MASHTRSAERARNALLPANTKDTATFPFDHLPAELKVEIFKLALVVNGTITVAFRRTDSVPQTTRLEAGHGNNNGKRCYLRIRALCKIKHKLRSLDIKDAVNVSVLHINKAIRYEARQILYKTNSFRFMDVRALQHFAELFGEAMKWLENVEVREISQNVTDHRSAMRFYTNPLSSLHITSNLQRLVLPASFYATMRDDETHARDFADVLGSMPCHDEGCVGKGQDLSKACNFDVSRYQEDRLAAIEFEANYEINSPANPTWCHVPSAELMETLKNAVKDRWSETGWDGGHVERSP